MKNKLRILSFYIGVNILGIPNITTHIIEDKKNKHYENHIHTTSNTFIAFPLSITSIKPSLFISFKNLPINIHPNMSK